MLLLALSTSKVGCSFVVETEWHLHVQYDMCRCICALRKRVGEIDPSGGEFVRLSLRLRERENKTEEKNVKEF